MSKDEIILQLVCSLNQGNTSYGGWQVNRVELAFEQYDKMVAMGLFKKENPPTQQKTVPMTEDKINKVRQLKEIHVIIKGGLRNDAKALYGSWEQMLKKAYEIEEELGL